MSDFWREFHGPNAAYVLDLYEQYQRDPQSVDAGLRELFAGWTPPSEDGANGAHLASQESTSGPASQAAQAVAGAANLAAAIRGFGHLGAQLDPLGSTPPGDPALDPQYHRLTEADLRALPAAVVGGPVAEGATHALEAITRLRAIYSSHTGYDYDHIRAPDERDWLRQMAETRHYRPPADPIDPAGLLDRLTQIEAFEKFLHRTFPGRTRFSIEGLDMLVPMLDELLGEAAESGFRSILIGMAHRGRLNVLAHVLNKPYAQILAEFRDPGRGKHRPSHDDWGWNGDVKYHLGARRALAGGGQVDMVVTMPPNPSHLEAINPVIQGMARAAGARAEQRGPARFDSAVTLPIIIHGDASFPGQGVVAETLNFSRLPGFRTAGAIHIISNNQLGFTAPPGQVRSSLYASDLAKGFKIPIVHVNADDPEACLEVARLAFAYRTRFEKDFLIDLIGYRRYGHNEGDEPSFTQPLMYQAVERQSTVREQWAQALVERGQVTADIPEAMLRDRLDKLQSTLDNLKPEDLVENLPTPPPPGAARRVKTGVPAETLREIHKALRRVPEGFTLHPKIERAAERRRKAFAEADPLVDWAGGEELAFATILADGTPIRLTGQDTERGTFSQRHAVLHDYKNGKSYLPLQNLPQARGAFEVRNSALSENGALGFEFGYNVQAPGRLVLWEAQYGDFINGAQAVIDEFILPARSKWGQTPSLVLLLPHGYEGQGPDHSSARLERFLNLAAELNVRIANPTTAAQYFHLLRRQAALLEVDPLPLVVLTPKSLLRHPGSASRLSELAEGHWQPMIDDARAQANAGQVRRLVLCSGKVFFDLAARVEEQAISNVALVRVEQLYPFPSDELADLVAAYSSLQDVAWVQEEPQNMGAWEFAQPFLRSVIGEGTPLRYVGRPRNASPAEGSAALHTEHQKLLIADALGV